MTKSKIQYLLIRYLQKFGSIDLTLPDGVELEIGITQNTKHGIEKSKDYCWITTQRDDRQTVLDRYSMSMLFDESGRLVDQNDGIVSIL